MVRVTYDSRIDAAYIYLKEIEAGEAVTTHPCTVDKVAGEVILDFNKEGKLIGIEVQNAKAGLPEEIIDQAERI